MRPVLKFLDEKTIERIISEAVDILCELGIDLHNKNVLELLSDHGAEVDMDNNHVNFTKDIIEKYLVLGICCWSSAHWRCSNALALSNLGNRL